MDTKDLLAVSACLFPVFRARSLTASSDRLQALSRRIAIWRGRTG